jgi:flavin reductase (DIM6/NTAB) family NADH-FMN oxidoreductase RutF
MSNEALADAVRSAMRCTASGVAILATDGKAGRAGVTVSTLCSLSLEPPSVIACVHKDSRTLRTVLANGVFSANILAQGQDAVATAFAGPMTDHHERFAIGGWADLDGLPRLEGAVASFACRLADSHSFGTHVILIGEIFDVAATDNPPLIYADRAFRSLTAA